MLDCKAESWYSMKAAQTGITETFINYSFHSLDQHNRSVLYILPNQNPDTSDFSSARIEPAIEDSEYIKGMFNTTRNVGLKMAGSIPFYLRGSKGEGGLRSIPVGVVILDEIDIMSPKAVARAKERLSGQFAKFLIGGSTPDIPGVGIDKIFQNTTKEFFAFRCPYCSRHTDLIFPECMEITAEHAREESIYGSYLLCKECKHKLDHETKYEWLADGKWEKQQASVVQGFHISQLYSSTIAPYELATSYLNAQHNPADEQEFFNSKLGLPHIVASSQLSDEDLIACTGSFKNGDPENYKGYMTMGIDIGSVINIVVVRWRFPEHVIDANMDAKGQVVLYRTLDDVSAGFHGLDDIVKAIKPVYMVIDGMPEHRSSAEFSIRFHGHASTCFYNDSSKGADIILRDHRVTVNRTYWLDASLGRFRNNRIKIPADSTEAFKKQLKSLVRVYGKKDDGSTTTRYKNSGADHYGHALNYAEIALAIGATTSSSGTVRIKS